MASFDAGLLAHRLGAGHVVSVDVDVDVCEGEGEGAVETARRRLARLGPAAEVVHGDGSAAYEWWIERGWTSRKG